MSIDPKAKAEAQRLQLEHLKWWGEQQEAGRQAREAAREARRKQREADEAERAT
jgi:hypothetical protein